MHELLQRKHTLFQKLYPNRFQTHFILVISKLVNLKLVDKKERKSNSMSHHCRVE